MELNTTVRESSRQGWFWLTISVVLVSVAQLNLKYAMQQLPDDSGMSGYLQIIEPIYLYTAGLPLLFGFGCYLASVLSWIQALRHLPLSLAYPCLALSYLLVYLGATLLPVFAEPTSAARLAGIGLVVVGVWLVSLPVGATRRLH